MIPADELFGVQEEAENLASEPVPGLATSPPSEPSGVALNSVEQALEQLRAGRPIVVIDDEDRENEGDMIFAAGIGGTGDFTPWEHDCVTAAESPACAVDQTVLADAGRTDDQKQMTGRIGHGRRTKRNAGGCEHGAGRYSQCVTRT